MQETMDRKNRWIAKLNIGQLPSHKRNQQGNSANVHIRYSQLEKAILEENAICSMI